MLVKLKEAQLPQRTLLVG